MILFLYVYEPFAFYLSVSCFHFFFFFDSNLRMPLPYGCKIVTSCSWLLSHPPNNLSREIPLR